MNKRIFTICSVFVLLICTIFSLNFRNNVYAEEIDSDCKAAVLMDSSSNEIIYSKNLDAKMQVASIVKLMTSLITIEEIDSGKIKLTDKVKTSELASGMGGSQIFLDPYVEYKVEDLLKGVIVASANDAAVALAEHISGNEQDFVKRMNKRANELGMKNTLYANSTGLPEPQQYSSAKDSAILLNKVLNHNLYAKYSKIWIDEIIHPSGRKTEIVNTNKLIRYFKGCDVGKTGFIDEAGYCLVASAKKDNMRLIACCLGANTKQKRFNEVSKLLNFGFSNYENKLIVSKSNIINKVKVNGSKIKEINLYPKEDFTALNKKGDKINYDINYILPKYLKAPMKKGLINGKIIISKNGNVIKEIGIVINEDINKLSYKEALEKISNNW